MARRGAAKEAANDTTRMELKTVVDNRTVGEILREARIARDEDYTEVSGQLRIRRAYMEAIEDGRFGDLPGSTYAIGFVRTYAEYLGLDVAKLVAKYKQEASEFEDQTKLVFPEPMPASRAPTASVIVVAILLLFGSYAGWLYISNKDQEQIALVPPLPEALQNLIGGAIPSQNEPETTTTAPVEQAEPPAALPPAPDATEDAEAPAVTERPSAVESQTAPAVVNETITSAAPEAAQPSSETVGALAPPATAPQRPEEVIEEAATAAATATSVATTETVGAGSEAVSDTTEEVAATALVEAETPAAEPAPQAQAEAPPPTSVDETVAAVATAVEPDAAAEPAASLETETPAAAETAVEAEAATEAEGAAVPQSAGVPESAGDAETATAPAPETAVETAPEGTSAVEPEPAADTEATADTVAAATPPAESFAVPLPNSAEPTQYGDASAASRILIRSVSAAWVEITEPNGNVLLTRLLRPGDSFQVPDRPGITLVTGNAGGLEFVVDGTTAPAIGDIGDVRRDVLLEPTALLQGNAASDN